MREDLLRFLPFHEEINSGVMPISRIEKKKLVTLMPEKHEVVSVKPEPRKVQKLDCVQIILWKASLRAC